MTAKSVAFLGYLAYRFPVLLPVFEEHLQDNDGEVIPHLLLADITRWLVDHVESKADEFTARAIVAAFEEAYSEDDDALSELIAVSFLENLPYAGERGDGLRSMVGRKLKQQLARMG